MSIEIPSKAAQLYPETLDGQRVVLGETKMGAIDYIKNFGGIVPYLMGNQNEAELQVLTKRFPELEKDQATGLIVTQGHPELARLAIDLSSYFTERAQQNTFESKSSRAGLRVNFADFTHRSLPGALYLAVIQPGHKTATLSRQALVRDAEYRIIGKEAPTKVEAPNDAITDLLSRLAKYHLEAVTAASLQVFRQGQQNRDAEVQAIRGQSPSAKVPSWLSRFSPRK